MSAFETQPGAKEQFLKRIAQEYEGLSGRLKLIARYIELHSDDLGLMGIRQFSGHCGVNPSTVVRFAQYFGFSGFSDMRVLFRDLRAPGSALASRSGCSNIDPHANGAPLVQLVDEVLAGNITRLENLRRTLDRTAFEKTVGLVERAEIVWIAGTRRAFPVAVYLDQALQHIGKRVALLGAFESLHVDQARAVRSGDLVVAIALGPYARETDDVVRHGLEKGARVVVITDSRMNPLARMATVLLVVQGGTVSSIDATAATTALVQALGAALQWELERGLEASRLYEP